MTPDREITLRYFAKFREQLGLSEETLIIPPTSDMTVQAILHLLISRGGRFQQLFDRETGFCVALNQTMVKRTSFVEAGDELALFPPVTGG